MNQRLTAARGTTGSAMVEMALLMPILLFIALGIVDFGRVMNYWNNTNQIASDAARFAAVNKNPGDDLDTPVDSFHDWIRGQAETGELREGDAGVAGGNASTTGTLQVCIDFPNGGLKTVGNPVRVTVRTGFNLIPLLNTVPDYRGSVEKREVFGTIKIEGQAVMRLERNYTQEEGCSPA